MVHHLRLRPIALGLHLKVMSSSEVPVNKTPMIIALILSLLLVVGVLVGAKLVFHQATSEPIAMSTLDNPDASSPECTKFIESVPDELLGHNRATIAEPAPPGAAAWKSSSLEQVTLRCGVDVPLQYTDLATLDDVQGTSWLTVVDATPGSSLRTFYALNRDKVIAVTSDAAGLQQKTVTDIGQQLATALDTLPVAQQPTHPLPLTDLDIVSKNSSSCHALLDKLPKSFSSSDSAEFTRTENGSLPKNTAAWTAKDFEPVILRCGTSFPQSYQAGAQLQQINDVVWFEDTTLGNGTTASAWFAVDGKDVVAVSMPQVIAQVVLAQFSPHITQKIPKQK